MRSIEEQRELLNSAKETALRVNYVTSACSRIDTLQAAAKMTMLRKRTRTHKQRLQVKSVSNVRLLDGSITFAVQPILRMPQTPVGKVFEIREYERRDAEYRQDDCNDQLRSASL